MTEEKQKIQEKKEIKEETKIAEAKEEKVEEKKEIKKKEDDKIAKNDIKDKNVDDKSDNKGGKATDTKSDELKDGNKGGKIPVKLGGEEPKEKKSESKQEKPDKKKEKIVPKTPKKTEAVVKATNLPISTKHSIAICAFIKGKKIDDAINDLEQVVKIRKAVPMKGEIPHRKGMMSGRYPKSAAQHFIKLLKTLKGNVTVNGLDEDVKISEAIANIGERPYGRFGFHRKKRSHVLLKVKQKQGEKKSEK